MRLARVLVAGIIVQPLVFGCFYELPRTEGLGDGEVRGRAVHTDGTPIASARVVVQGTLRAAEADADGRFAVRGLAAGPVVLLVTADDDGDGTPDAAARVTAVLVNAAIPKNATDGCAGTPPVVPTSVLLGDVVLAPTRSLDGTVRLDDGGGPRLLTGSERALVVRTSGAAFSESDDEGALQGPVEAAAGVAADGTFALAGLRDDDDGVDLTVLVFDAATGPYVPTFFGTKAAAAADDDVALIADQAVPAQTGVQLALTGAFTDVEVGTVSFELPGGGDVAAPDGTLQRAENSGFAGYLVVDAPVGLYDVGVFPSPDSTDVTEGYLRGALVLPLAAWGAIAGPIELAADDPCLDADGARDCDHDGRATLRSPDDPVALADWTACAAACADTFGPDGDGATCEVGGTAIDCDDDGDGQPDVTEPAHCLGPGRGTDLDGDGRCEPREDPFPSCASDDPAVCPAPFSPPPPRY
ncbi:MAG: carboxypeptidase regulatory-like domain-containing protein [Deltaproteobacteria bacterium]|nr:carboxypeptidase regulatory-like domain-containing protein [Deltaproteobacteria bacterium]